MVLSGTFLAGDVCAALLAAELALAELALAELLALAEGDALAVADALAEAAAELADLVADGPLAWPLLVQPTRDNVAASAQIEYKTNQLGRTHFVPQ